MTFMCIYVVVIISIYVHCVYGNSCIIYRDETSCTQQSICAWDASLAQCVCNSVLPSDVVIIMDSSGSVQNSGWDIEKEFVANLIATGIPSTATIGIIQFASQAWTRYEFIHDQNRSAILDVVNNLQWTLGWTYMKDAVQAAIDLFETQSLNQQRRIVLITDGNPNPPVQTPCDLVPLLDDLNVEVLVIGVGVSWTRARIDCLVNAPEDIVEVDAFDPYLFDEIRDLTDEFLCSRISFLLTEVKPVLGPSTSDTSTAAAYHRVPFVEFYNNAKDMDLALYSFRMEGTFEGSLTSVDRILHSVHGTLWPYGTYLVVFDSRFTASNNVDDTAWCFECICALLAPANRFCNASIYVQCDGVACGYNLNYPNAVDRWSVVVHDETESVHHLMMNVTYGMGPSPSSSSDWITIDAGYSYELIDDKYAVCPPTDGQCWQPSCTVYGTPGALPIDCGCSDAQCQTGGDVNATCDHDPPTDACQCSLDHCYALSLPATASRCHCVTPPINCSIVLHMDAVTGLPLGDASWQKPTLDWSLQYTLYYEVQWHTYQNDEHSLKLEETPINQRAYTLYDMEYRAWTTPFHVQSVRAVVDFGAPQLYFSDWIACELQTLAPTVSPTPAPTLGLPPIDDCNVSVTSASDDAWITIRVQWTPADLSHSHTFDASQFDDKYKVYLTHTSVYVAGTDTLQVETGKVWKQTFFVDSVTAYNVSQLVRQQMLQVAVSVVVHDLQPPFSDLDDVDAAFDRLMYAQATVCQWYTSAPTAAPTQAPTALPTSAPTDSPTLKPTLAPTFAWWMLMQCVVDVDGQQWRFTWIENPNSIESLPEQRKIYVMIDGTARFILNENQFSPQQFFVDSQSLSTSRLTDVEVVLVAQQLTSAGDSSSLRFSPYSTTCQVRTSSPSLSPTASPVTAAPTHTPIVTPTQFPTFSPTRAPTFHLPIDWCRVLLLNDNFYKITFEMPDFSLASAPSITSVKYVIYIDNQLRNDITSEAHHIDDTNLTFTLASNGYDIDAETLFAITTSNLDSSVFFADLTPCTLLTQSPTLSPSLHPSHTPTASPTHPPVATFVYSDDTSICGGVERCACHVDRFNYECVGSDFPSGPQIEHSQVMFMPSDGVRMPVLWLARYPYNLNYSVSVEWHFEYLNESFSFSHNERINPNQGTTVIPRGEYLGKIVYAIFVPLPNELYIQHPQWYKFHIDACNVLGASVSEANEINCEPIYPQWAYIVWIPSQAVEALLIVPGEDWPDWIFYLLLAASVSAVAACYVYFVFLKNRNLKNNVNTLNTQSSQAMLGGIAPSAHVVGM